MSRSPNPGQESRSGGFLTRLAGSPRVRLAAFAAVLVIASGALLVTSGGLDEGSVEQAFEDLGAGGALVVYPLAYAVLTVLLFPGAVITAAGGALFGAWLGTLLSLAGATAGSTVAFLIGRRLGREQVEQIAGRRIVKFDDWLERRGFLAVLYLRLIPVLPFNALNYGAGVTRVSLRDYVLGTAIGIVPGTFAYAALGGSLHDPTSPEFLGAVGLVVMLAVAAPYLNRRLQARGSGAPAEKPG